MCIVPKGARDGHKPLDINSPFLLSLLGVWELGSFGGFLEYILLISYSPNLPKAKRTALRIRPRLVEARDRIRSRTNSPS